MQKDPEEFIWDVKRPGKVKMQTATSKCRQALLPTVSAPDSTIVYELETAIVANTGLVGSAQLLRDDRADFRRGGKRGKVPTPA